MVSIVGFDHPSDYSDWFAMYVLPDEMLESNRKPKTFKDNEELNKYSCGLNKEIRNNKNKPMFLKYGAGSDFNCNGKKGRAILIKKTFPNGLGLIDLAVYGGPNPYEGCYDLNTTPKKFTVK